MIRVFQRNGSYRYKAVLNVPPCSIVKRGQGYQSADEAYAMGREDLANAALLVVSEHWELARTYLEEASRCNERGKVVSHIARAKQEMEIAVRILRFLSFLQNNDCPENEQLDIRIYPISLEDVSSLAYYGSLKRVKRLLLEILEQFPPSPISC